MIWDITPKKDADGDDEEWGVPRKVLKGMSHLFIFIKDTITSFKISPFPKTLDSS